ncbi:lymphocyte antigen 6 complex locus protein G6d-like [Bombina bombina]|uniref:lymphocyte antigen 6 complex locus protein G6d-like n=1 Tax=Bombina bombina TaxID=8345 RepID=UPI00235AB56B|nr:lymphocyte antigen 6 complex locus protein G6d-like [Bombina bombina]
MNSFFIVLCVLLSCHIGHALQCYSCDYGACLFPSKITCGALEVCATLTSSLTDFLSFKNKGCLNPVNCLSEVSETYLGVTVTTKPSCCFTNLCNSAVTPGVSIITGTAAVVALWLVHLF